MSRTVLHTRELAIDAEPANADRLRVRAELRDQRHFDLPGYLGVEHPAGVVHHMGLELEIDRELTIVAVSPWMQTIPFQPSSTTRGEGCRNILPSYQSLVGLRLDGTWASRVFESVGGPLGCFHLLSLGQCLPLAVRAAASLLCGGARRAPAGAQAAVVDSCAEWRRGGPRSAALEPSAGSGLRRLRRRMRIEAWTETGAALGMDGRLDDDLEGEGATGADLDLVLAVPGFAIVEAEARQRGAPFPGCPAALQSAAALRGLSISKGFTNAALAQVGGACGCAHVAAMVVALTPVTAQAAGALAGFLGFSPSRKLRGHATSPQVDSCHMWRRNGPLMSLASKDENGVS